MRLGRVGDEALADQRVERLLGDPRGQRLLHDVPDQQLVVRPHRQRLVVVDTEGALEPPVRRVQGVRVVGAVRLESGLAHLGEQLVGPVDADVAALDLVVGVGERPADLLGAVAGHGDGDAAAGLEDADHLGEDALVVGDVLHHLGDDDDVEGLVGEGQRERVALHRGGGGARGGLAGLLHRREPLGDLADLLGVLVQGHDLGAAPVALEGVPAGAAAEVQDTVAGGEREPGEVDGQHVALLSEELSESGAGAAETAATGRSGRLREGGRRRAGGRARSASR